MKVSQLISELLTLNPDTQILLASDEEGNNYMPLYSVEKARCTRDDFEFIVIFDDDLVYNYEIVDAEECVVLFP